jgi:starch synthase
MGQLYQFIGNRRKCAQSVTTVSPSYLNEINYSANGLESHLVRDKSKGILNGIDFEVWDPANDAIQPIIQ